ncbi:MarR family transcriptional regulator, partial [Rhizobiaceae sp. 2RAB30]
MDDFVEARPAANVLALEDFLPYRLNRLADAVSREFQKIYKERHGLTRPEWRTLATLGQFGTMTATGIG